MLLPSIQRSYRHLSLRSNRNRYRQSPLWDFGAGLHPMTKNTALLVGHAAHIRERHRALDCYARFDPPGVLFHLRGGVEHDSLWGNREGAAGRLLRVTFDTAAVH